MEGLRKTLALLLLLATLPHAAAEGSDDLAPLFQHQLGKALAQRNARGVQTLIPFLSLGEVDGLLQVPSGRLRMSLRALGAVGEGALFFFQFEEVVGAETQALFQALCELRRVGDTAVAVRRVPVPEAARAFRIAAHHSAVRIEADTGATEMLDKIEIAVLRPTRWIFFFLDSAREVRAVSIEASGAEIFRVANFVALERATAWAVGDRVRLEVRSRLRLTRKKTA